MNIFRRAVILLPCLAVPTILVGATLAANDVRLLSAESYSVSDPDLRSAYLIKNDRRAYDRDADPVDELRSHFSAVIRVLIQQTDVSLDLALERWQTHHGETLAESERQQLRVVLWQRRIENILQLQRYRIRGQFPKNEISSTPIPIFVDRHHTACAVGHLMRVSGFEQDVETVRDENNFVLVTDVRDGTVLEWILESGLTQDEAAMIQPAYVEVPPGYISLYYDPSSGNLGLDSGGNMLTTLEIVSNSGVFTGTQPADVQPPFDVFTPNKFFLLKTAGIGNSDFGPAMAPGIPFDFLIDDLSVSGSVLPAGPIPGYCLPTVCVPEPASAQLGLVGFGLLVSFRGIRIARLRRVA